ncbi:MAG: EamA family transporter [bacterium]|nr:EamA family transporter [bacterium]
MPWQLLLGISIIGEVIGRLLQRTIMKEDKSDPIAYAVIYQIIGGIIIGIFALVKGFQLPQDITPILPNLLIMPVLYAITNICMFTALKKTEASIFTILFASYSIWLIVGSIFVFREPFSFLQIIGTVLILLSVILVSWKHKNIKIGRAELITLSGAIVFAAAILNDTIILQKGFDPASYLSISFLAPGLFLWLLYPKRTKEIVAIGKSAAVKKVILMAFIYGIVTLTYYYAFLFGKNAAQIASINQINTVLTVIAAVIILKERSHLLLKLSAVAMSFVGVLLVS